MAETILEIKNLEVVYKTRKNVFGAMQTVYAVNDVSLSVNKGEILAIAGESGCGKSTLAKAVMKLVPTSAGEILFEGKSILNQTSYVELKGFYKNLQMIFQNPYSSLNPKMKIGEILSEPLEINTDLTKGERQILIEETLEKVGLEKSLLNQYPHEFSGGQRQRIAIARALLLTPKFIVADEPVSALDVSIQAQIINLLKQLKEEYNLTFMFISHDLSVIKYLADRIAIMYLGEIIEFGKTEELFANTKHPYTKALLSSEPELTPHSEKERITLQGELPSPENLPQGCKFHTRCPFVMDICKSKVPHVTDFSETHSCKCFLYENSVV